MDEQKTLKQYAKEAKKRLKSGFWQSYHKNLDQEIQKAEQNGISASKVKEYYSQQVSENIRSYNEENEEFYLKVKNILDSEGEIPNVIGRLTDREVFDSLPYEEKQRYTLNLSEKYLVALERYNKEKAIKINE